MPSAELPDNAACPIALTSAALKALATATAGISVLIVAVRLIDLP